MPAVAHDRLRLALDRVAFAAVSFLLPSRCFACHRSLGRTQHLGACHRCWARLQPLRDPVCTRCGLALAEGTDLLGPASGACAACIGRRGSVEAMRAAVIYDATARRFLLRAKLGHRRELLRPLGEQLARAMGQSGFAADSELVVPVPSHPWSRWSRGFNAARELGAVVARRTGHPFDPHALAVRWAKTAVKTLPAPSRRSRTRNAFRARRRLRGSSVLLVDDVITTGATAEACATALRRAGARQVRVAAWARTPPPGHPV